MIDCVLDVRLNGAKKFLRKFVNRLKTSYENSNPFA